MGRLVSIDPGVRFLGWAFFHNKRLMDCGLLKAKGLDDMLERCRQFESYDVDHVVIEKPQVYIQRKMKGDANDLITIALVAGYVGAFFKHVNFVKPRDWKGTVDKEVMCKRVVSRWMNEREREILARLQIPKSYVNNTVDAIGVGLHWMGRNR